MLFHFSLVLAFRDFRDFPSNKFPLVFENSMKKLVKSKGCRVQIKLVGPQHLSIPTNFICTPQLKTYQFHLYPAAFRFDEFFQIPHRIWLESFQTSTESGKQR